MVSTKKTQGTSKTALKSASKSASKSAPNASSDTAAQAVSADVVPARTTPVLSDAEKQEILNLSPRREQILALVNRYPGLNSTQLGELINVSMTAASGVLCELFDKQYVHRRRTVAQPGKKVAPYVYFYGRDAGQAYGTQPTADQVSAAPPVQHIETPALAPTPAPASTRRHAPPPPPVAADPSLFEAEERALLEASGASVRDVDQAAPEVAAPAASSTVSIEPVAVHAPEPPASQAPAPYEVEDIVQVNFDASSPKPAAAPPAPPNRLGTMPAQARSTPARAATATAMSTSAHSVSLPAQATIVTSLSEAIDELSDRLVDVVDGMAEHFADRLSSALSDLVVQAISKKLTKKLHSKTVARLEDVIDQMLPSEVEAIEEDAGERMKLANVVIVGLLPEQENMIKDEFKDCFRLRFWKDGNPKSLREISGNADHILTFVDKIGHKHEDAIMASGRKPDRVTGGMSSLRKRLTEIYVNQ